jgi:tripartite-type tricarboxylate transporter receptor subunit TctC
MKRSTAKCALAFFALGLVLTTARAQDYPTRAIRMIAGAIPGGSVDLGARIIGQKLGDVLGQQIVIENRPGASGMIAAESVAKANPDGYTILWEAGDFITVSSLMPHTTFDPNKGLLPLAMVSNGPLVIVARSDAPFSDVKELIATARSKPSGLTYATYGIATGNNVVGQWIAVETQTKLLHVPYRSGPDAVLGAATGDVDIAIIAPASVYPTFTEAKKVKVIALTGTERPSYLPSSWPTLIESGLPIDATVFFGVFGPVGIPDPIISRVDEAIDLILQDQSVRERLVHAGFNPEYMASSPFAKRIRADKTRYDRIIRQVGMQIEQ